MNDFERTTYLDTIVRKCFDHWNEWTPSQKSGTGKEAYNTFRGIKDKGFKEMAWKTLQKHQRLTAAVLANMPDRDKTTFLQ